jgi:hypothetical protein
MAGPYPTGTTQDIQRVLIIDVNENPAGASAGSTGSSSGSSSAAGAAGTAVASSGLSAPQTASGSVTAGARALTFIFSADFTGTMDGGAVSGASLESFNYFVPAGCTLPAIPYTVTAGSLQYLALRSNTPA